MDNLEKSPEEITREAAEKKSREEQRRKWFEEAKIAVNSASENPNVRILLRYLMSISGYQTLPIVIGQNSEIQVSSTIYNNGREAIYHDIRKLMSVETKNIVERSE